MAAWRIADVDNSSELTSVSCPSASLCVAGDQPGNVLAGLGHTLSVVLGGTGSGKVVSSDLSISCTSSCSSSQAAGATVTLTATADDGSTFTGWSGGCTGAGTCAVGIDSDRTVTATFVRDPAPPGGGQTPPGGGHEGSGWPPPPPPPPPPPSPPPPRGPVVAVAKPSCRLHADGARISARVRIQRTRHGARRTLQPKRTVRLAARCDQAARLSLSATVTSVIRVGAGHAHGRTRSRIFHVGPVVARAMAGRALTLAMKLPAAALAAGSRDSVTFALTARNAHGSSVALSRIARLTLV